MQSTTDTQQNLRLELAGIVGSGLLSDGLSRLERPEDVRLDLDLVELARGERALRQDRRETAQHSTNCQHDSPNRPDEHNG